MAVTQVLFMVAHRDHGSSESFGTCCLRAAAPAGSIPVTQATPDCVDAAATPARGDNLMHLPPEQTARFYRIWFALLHYVNDQRHLLPTFPASPGEATIPPADAKRLRDALWADDPLREQFIAENPA